MMLRSPMIPSVPWHCCFVVHRQGYTTGDQWRWYIHKSGATILYALIRKENTFRKNK